MGFTLKFREQLIDPVLSELENLSAAITGWVTKEHNLDGTHGDMTADSLNLQGGPTGEVVNVPKSDLLFSNSGAGTWTVSDTDFQYFRYVRVGQLLYVHFHIIASSLSSATTSLYITLPGFYLYPEVNGNGTFFQNFSMDWTEPTATTSGVGVINITQQDTGLRLGLSKGSSAGGSIGTGNWTTNVNDIYIRANIGIFLNRNNVFWSIS